MTRTYMVTNHQYHTHGGRCVAVGALIGALLMAASAWACWPPVGEGYASRLCSWPVMEGEMTVVTVLDGKVVCWRWR